MLFKRATEKERHGRSDGAMTPMIDVVFQLLAFFILTFQLVVPEGDFDIEMPLTSPAAEAPQPRVEPLKVRLMADAGGRLADVRVSGRSLGRDLESLERHIKRLAGSPTGPDGMKLALEVEFDCDANLRYEHTMAALASVAGDLGASGERYALVERLRFARRKNTAR